MSKPGAVRLVLAFTTRFRDLLTPFPVGPPTVRGGAKRRAAGCVPRGAARLVAVAAGLVHAADEHMRLVVGGREVTLTPTALVPLSIPSQSLPGASANANYSYQLQAQGGAASYTWSLTSGALPAGLSLSPAGLISGKPLSAGTFTFTAQASDTSSPTQTAEASYSLTVVPVISNRVIHYISVQVTGTINYVDQGPIKSGGIFAIGMDVANGSFASILGSAGIPGKTSGTAVITFLMTGFWPGSSIGTVLVTDTSAGVELASVTGPCHDNDGQFSWHRHRAPPSPW